MRQWRGPRHDGDFPSLGWDLLDWLSDVLPSPRDAGSPLEFTNEQARLLVRWYEIHPVTGQFVYRRGQSRRSKGIGKSPFEAAKVIAELAGPVVFDGWDANGDPIARPWGTGELPNPWVQVGAVSEDQTDNTWSVVHAFLTENDGQAADELRIDAGLTRCFLRDRTGRAEPVTAAAGSREGQPVTYAVLDETHLWTTRNGGVKLASTLRRNAAKMGGRSFETTNAYVPGEGSVAEASERAAQRSPSIFVDAVEAPRVLDGVTVDLTAPDETLARALRVAYGDAWWVNIERLVAEARDPDTAWEDTARFFFNWSIKGAGKAVDPKRWAELTKAHVPPPGTRIGLGFDGSISGDCTALVGCTAEGHSWLLAAWERPPGATDWKVPRLAVHDAVAAAFDTWDVGLMFADPPKWWTEIEQWAETYRLPGRTGPEAERVAALDTNQERRFSRAVDRWLTALREGTHTNNGDELLTRHVEAAHLRKLKASADETDGRTLYVIVKGDDGRKIDACIADVLAHEAAAAMPALAPAFDMASQVW